MVRGTSGKPRMIHRQSFEVFILPVKSAFRGLFDKKWNLCKALDYLSLQGFLSLWSKNVFFLPVCESRSQWPARAYSALRMQLVCRGGKMQVAADSIEGKQMRHSRPALRTEFQRLRYSQQSAAYRNTKILFCAVRNFFEKNAGLTGCAPRLVAY